MPTVDWVNFGLAGLFAVFAIYVLNRVFDFVDKFQSKFDARNQAVVGTLTQVQQALTKLTEVFLEHDKETKTVLEMLIKMNEASEHPVTVAVRPSSGGKQGDKK